MILLSVILLSLLYRVLSLDRLSCDILSPSNEKFDITSSDLKVIDTI